MNIEFSPMENLRLGNEVHLRVMGHCGDRYYGARVIVDAVMYDSVQDLDSFLKWEEESLREAVRIHVEEDLA